MATKKKVIKELKALAATMPTIQARNNFLGEPAAGKELLKMGITKLPDGTVVEAKGVYTRKSPVVAIVDHVERMKKVYSRYGANGVRQYIAAVEKFEQENRPKPAEQSATHAQPENNH